MNFVKMMEARGINLEKLSEYEFAVLLHAISQEKERRVRVKREQLITEYTDKLDDLADKIIEKGMVIYYNATPLDIRELSVNWKDD